MLDQRARLVWARAHSDYEPQLVALALHIPAFIVHETNLRARRDPSDRPGCKPSLSALTTSVAPHMSCSGAPKVASKSICNWSTSVRRG